MLTFNVEPITQEMFPLIQLHWEENGQYRDRVQLEPDILAYERLESCNALCLVTARSEGWLVGYYLSNVLRHPHYRETLFSFNDAYYLLPEFRKANNGIQLLRAYEDAMRGWAKAAGFDKIVLVGRARLNMETAGLFDRLEWVRSELCFTKLLEV
jgi:GNAT superfamily N-acetyltransferase